MQQFFVRTICNVAVYAALLFVPAWTLHWWRGWLLVALIFAGMIATRCWVFRDNQELLAERRESPFQPGQPLADKLLVCGFVMVFPAYIMFIPLDVFHWHLLPKPSAPVSWAGLILAVIGWYVISLAFRENAFAAAIVKPQEERRQIVVDTGIYSVVRHPLYAGVMLVIIGVALWLQSYAAAILSVVPIAVVVLRILVEEDFLRNRLTGYDAYVERVGHRLIPLIW